MKTKRITKLLTFLICSMLLMGLAFSPLSADTVIQGVDVTVTVPAVGEHPDFQASVPTDDPYLLATVADLVSGVVGPVFWYDVTGIDQKDLLTETSVFVPQHTYRVEVWLSAQDGYDFAGDTLSAYINEEIAEIREAADPPNGIPSADIVCIAYDFYLGDISSVAVTDLKLPVGGETPDYEVSLPDGAKYHVENNEGDGWTNGMLWIDLDTGETVAPTDTFIAGHEYSVLVGLIPEDDLYFSGFGVMEGTINGEAAFVYFPTEGIRLEMIYTALPGDNREVINVAAITGLTLPVAGETPDYEVGVPSVANYYVANSDGDGWTNGMLWIDVKADKAMTAADKFVAGREYQVLIGVMPKEGYKFSDDVLGTINDEEATVLTPTNGIRLEKTYVAEGGDAPVVNPFDDVKAADYFYDPVLWAVEEGITKGVDENSFGPDEKCTRAQAVTFLWRAAGEPAPKSATHPFTDVVKGSYYEKAVIWAVEKGITAGTSATTFEPDTTCTRGQIVTFLWRFENKPAYSSLEMPFVDVAPGFYYEDAVLWAVEKDITKGTSATTFEPDAKCTRGQIVTFLYRDIVL